MRVNFLLSEVATGLRRNLAMTIAMILTTAVSLCFFGTGLLVAKQIDKMKQLYFDKLEVSVYLQDGITPAQLTGLRDGLQSSPEVKSVQYMSKDQALARFRVLFKSNPDLVANATADDLPATYLVQLKDPQRYPIINQEFHNAPGVSGVGNQSQVLDRVFADFNGVRNLVIFAALVMAVASLLLIANTVQVAAFNRRVETGIMRLVGASRWYTQLPFVLEAVVAGLAGALLAVGGMFILKVFVSGVIGDLIRSGVVPALDVSTIFGVSQYVALVGVGMAAVAAYVTLRLYVRL